MFLIEVVKIIFSPIKHLCPICNASISSTIEIDEENRPRFNRVSEWVCDNGHVITNEELLGKLKESIKSFNLTA